MILFPYFFIFTSVSTLQDEAACPAVPAFLLFLILDSFHVSVSILVWSVYATSRIHPTGADMEP
ncbi:hypothetical protein TMatcc_006743 [Talaromyces marneffei ATCC 18224]